MMVGRNITNKQLLMQQLRKVAEKKTAWLENNRPLYTEKRSRLNSLLETRTLSAGEVTPEEQNLAKHVALYESRRSEMWDLAEEINREAKNLEAMKAD